MCEGARGIKTNDCGFAVVCSHSSLCHRVVIVLVVKNKDMIVEIVDVINIECYCI